MTNTNEVRIETCTLCNYKCMFCPYSTTFNRKKEVMSLELFMYLLSKIKDEAPQITDCTISGFGEATLDDTLLEKIKYAKSKEMNVHFLTNGSLLDNELIDNLLELEIDSFRISLHAIEGNTYSLITGQTKYNIEQILESIKYIIKKSSNKIIITSDIINENREEIKNIISSFDKKAILEIWEPHNWTDWGKYREGKIIKQTCGRPFNGPIQVQVNGTINMCCFDYNGKLLLGDFKIQTLEEIFNSEPYLTIKKHHEKGTIEKSRLLCKTCDQLIDAGKDILIYNNKFSIAERLGKTSTNYRSVENV